MAETNIREAVAEINVVGILSEKNLELVNEGTDKECIRGSMTLKTSDTSFIELNVFVNKFTKSGAESKAYPGICTVMDTYKSIADVGEENATVVSVRKGRIQPQTYYSTKTNNFGDSVRYSANFFNTAKPEEEFGNNGCIEGYVKAKRPELDKEGEETGRLIVTLLVPTYNCIEPIEIIADNKPDANDNNWADLIDSYYDIGASGMFYITAVNEAHQVVKEIPMLGGTVRKETETHYERGIVITGASEPYESEDGGKGWSDEIIRKTLVEREAVLEERKNKAIAKENGGAKPASATNSSAGAAAGRSMPWSM